MAGKPNFAAMLLGPKSKPDAGPPSGGGMPPSTDPMESAEGEGGMCSCPSCGAPLQLKAADMGGGDMGGDMGAEAPPMGGQSAT